MANARWQFVAMGGKGGAARVFRVSGGKQGRHGKCEKMQREKSMVFSTFKLCWFFVIFGAKSGKPVFSEEEGGGDQKSPRKNSPGCKNVVVVEVPHHHHHSRPGKKRREEDFCPHPSQPKYLFERGGGGERAQHYFWRKRRRGRGGQKFYGPRNMAASGEWGGSVIFYLPFLLWESIVRAKGEAKGFKIERRKEKIGFVRCRSIFWLLCHFS